MVKWQQINESQCLGQCFPTYFVLKRHLGIYAKFDEPPQRWKEFRRIPLIRFLLVELRPFHWLILLAQLNKHSEQPWACKFQRSIHQIHVQAWPGFRHLEYYKQPPMWCLLYQTRKFISITMTCCLNLYFFLPYYSSASCFSLIITSVIMKITLNKQL